MGKRAGSFAGHVKVGAMKLVAKRNYGGQSLVEYAIVAAIVSAAIIAMSTYVYRSVQATQKVIQEEFRSY
jgi:Flp pilus assembly pilin Flp